LQKEPATSSYATLHMKMYW